MSHGADLQIKGLAIGKGIPPVQGICGAGAAELDCCHGLIQLLGIQISGNRRIHNKAPVREVVAPEDTLQLTPGVLLAADPHALKRCRIEGRIASLGDVGGELDPACRPEVTVGTPCLTCDRIPGGAVIVASVDAGRERTKKGLACLGILQPLNPLE